MNTEPQISRLLIGFVAKEAGNLIKLVSFANARSPRTRDANAGYHIST